MTQVSELERDCVTQVSELELSDLPASALSSLSQCRNLRHLVMLNCGLRATDGLQHLKHLEYVNLQVKLFDCLLSMPSMFACFNAFMLFLLICVMPILLYVYLSTYLAVYRSIYHFYIYLFIDLCICLL